MDLKAKNCDCGNEPVLVDYYVKGIANHKNYFVRCKNCRVRTRSRKTMQGAVEEWNEFLGSLYKG